jgi:hypothetical protein
LIGFASLDACFWSLQRSELGLLQPNLSLLSLIADAAVFEVLAVEAVCCCFNPSALLFKKHFGRDVLVCTGEQYASGSRKEKSLVAVY